MRSDFNEIGRPIFLMLLFFISFIFPALGSIRKSSGNRRRASFVTSAKCLTITTPKTARSSRIVRQRRYQWQPQPCQPLSMNQISRALSHLHANTALTAKPLAMSRPIATLPIVFRSILFLNPIFCFRTILFLNQYFLFVEQFCFSIKLNFIFVRFLC